MKNFKKTDSDIFLDAVGDTKPLKRKDRNTKKIPKKINKKNHSIVIESDEAAENNLKNSKTNTTQTTQKPILNKRSVLKKIRQKSLKINLKIDLHGLSLNQAKNLFIETIENCYVKNKRCVLFVTGKGEKKPPDHKNKPRLYYGKIRGDFLNWVKDSKVSQKILSATSAPPSHGGDGAFIVYLRKNKA